MPTSKPVFHVEGILNGNDVLPHHASVAALWKDKWRDACARGLYPFYQGNVEDFDPIFAELSKHDNSILRDPEAYASAFISTGAALFKAAEEAESHDPAKAKDLFLRASVVYRISRFPIIRRESKTCVQAWESGKEAYMRASKYFSSPVHEITIGKTPVYVQVPPGQAPAYGWPVLLYIYGLDGYRTDNTGDIDKHLQQGFVVISIEIPGTGDCPADVTDPASMDRILGEILDWVSSTKDFTLDSKTVCARGVSTGSYYAIRLAHAYANKLTAVVAQGTWSHYALSPEWLTRADRGEYPFGLAEAFVYRLGYSSLDAALKDDIMTKYSLLSSGLLDKPCCKLLLVNGQEDSIFPIEDTWLVAQHGRPKDVRVVEGAGHMGEPGAGEIINNWITEQLRSRPLKLVSVNNAPERARRLIGRVLADVPYNVVHAANIPSLEAVPAVLEAVVPDLVFTASMWTPEESQTCMQHARRINPNVKTLALPQGLQVSRGPDAVVDYIKEQLPIMMGEKSE